MKPLDLYNSLKSRYPNHEVACVCCVESTCCKRGFCSEVQHTKVLDFDKIKDEFYHGKTIAMPASVDAVCVGSLQKYFCFVELKGWENYIRFLDKQKNNVKETVDGYNLNGKLYDSQFLCIELTKKTDLFGEMPIIFLLVTDIDVKTNGIVSFADMMNKLGSNSTDVYLECLSESKCALDSKIHIDHDYIFCREFDNKLSVL